MKNRMQALRCLPVLLLALLAGCSTLDKMGRLLLNPDLPLGGPDQQPSQLFLLLLAEDASADNKTSEDPVRMLVFQLADDSRLLAATREELQSDPKQALGVNYLWHQEYTLVPGQFKALAIGAVNPESHYLAAVVLNDLADAHHWRASVRIHPIGHRYQILLTRQHKQLIVKKDEE
ncbi:type VI secretion system lipoprotein TssJ [Pseudaeromonas sharmana]|uniref:Type VI secretion system lipoprotein TssJ n=1 Tax=Pseudaeromonas sharmana TaxID=328412 RepID=A0ABV8CNM8_9GAMM